MDELKFLTAFRTLAEKIEYLEKVNENYYAENTRLKSEIAKLNAELEASRG